MHETVAHRYNPSAREAGAGRLLHVLDEPGLHSETFFQRAESGTGESSIVRSAAALPEDASSSPRTHIKWLTISYVIAL